jgi:cytochrome c oxidase subunit 2
MRFVAEQIAKTLAVPAFAHCTHKAAQVRLRPFFPQAIPRAAKIWLLASFGLNLQRAAIESARTRSYVHNDINELTLLTGAPVPMSKIIKHALAVSAGFLLAGPASAAWDLNLKPGITELSQEAYRLHMLILWWCVGIAVVVFGAMIYSIIKFRRSTGAKADTSITHSTTVEIIWTVIPIVILVVMAIPAARALIKIEDTSNSQLSIKVTGFQWKWHYEYLDQGVNFYSTLDAASNETRQLDSGKSPDDVPNYLLNVDNPMVVPLGKKVRILLTAGDVIHAWWVPALGVKKDAIPGFVNEMWFEAKEIGTFRGQCAELCGRDHGFMPIVVEVKSEADYQAWLEARKAPVATAAVAAAN